MNYIENIENKEAFVQSIKDRLSQQAFSEIEKVKREMSNEFLQPKGNENESF